jgi:amino acid transporter
VFLSYTASNCIVFSQYVLFACGVEAPREIVRKGLAVALLSAVTVVHGCFRKLGVQIQNVLGWLKIGLIVFMILSGIYVVLFRPVPEHIDAASWPDDFWTGSVWNWGIISTALFKVFYSYSGLDNANNVLNEVKDPVRTLSSVSLTALVTTCVLYLLINVAYFMVVPIDTIKSSGELVGALFFQGVFGAHLGGKLLPFAIALSAAGNVMVASFAQVSLRPPNHMLLPSDSAI